jgi:1-acyl-sn-glycerol-3-phosphate acyltransferase
MKTGVPLIPVAISGTADIFSKLRKGSKAIISMVIGKPYNLPNLPDTSRRDAIRIHTDYIMQKIADLLPDHHRGMYKKQ